jgi:hypothetical protein
MKKRLDRVKQFLRKAREKYAQKGEENGDAEDHTERMRRAKQRDFNEVSHLKV